MLTCQNGSVLERYVYPSFQVSFLSLFYSFLVHIVYILFKSHSLHFDVSFLEKKLSFTWQSSAPLDMLLNFRALSLSFHCTINCSFTAWMHTGTLIDCEALFKMIFQYWDCQIPAHRIIHGFFSGLCLPYVQHCKRKLIMSTLLVIPRWSMNR